MKKTLLITIILIALSSVCFARPEYSVLQAFGTKCTSCHIVNQGGGLRNNAGWMSRKDVSVLNSLTNPSNVGLGWLYDGVAKSNTLLDDKITFGFDFREESASLGTTKKTIWMMQGSPYVSAKPFDWLELEGFYNLAYNIEKDYRYPGQQPGAISADIKFGKNLPSLRVGFFQPTIGTKFDDHTLFIRNYVDNNGRSPLIPPDYAELGAQLDYESIDWLGASFGVFNSKNLNTALGNGLNVLQGQSVDYVNKNTPNFVFKLAFYPQPFNGINYFFGGYTLINSGLHTAASGGGYDQYFYMADLFFNIGLTDRLALMTEYMRSYKNDERSTDNFLAELNYQIWEPVILYAKAERANTDYIDPTSGVWHTNQFVFGANIFVLPYIEFVPEYKIQNKEFIPGFGAHWDYQLHIFY